MFVTSVGQFSILLKSNEVFGLLIIDDTDVNVDGVGGLGWIFRLSLIIDWLAFEFSNTESEILENISEILNVLISDLTDCFLK